MRDSSLSGISKVMIMDKDYLDRDLYRGCSLTPGGNLPLRMSHALRNGGDLRDICQTRLSDGL